MRRGVASPRHATPHAPRITPRITLYQEWLARERGLYFDSYDALWLWSTTDLSAFWASIWEHFQIESPTPYRCVLEAPVMPGAVWFPGAQVNYARQALRHAAAAHTAGQPAIVFQHEGMAAPEAMSWPELRRQVGAVAARLQGAGVVPGDRVCAYLPNAPETVVALLACASVGAIWSVCSPDMGPVAVLDRFRQIAPKVLLAVDGQVWGGVAHDRRAVLHEVLAALPSVEHIVLLPRLGAALSPADLAATFATSNRTAHAFADWTAGDPGDWQPAWLPFDHPLWIVYSSGTTGLPKPIGHGHGGVMLEALKCGVLHNDLTPSAETGKRYHWFSSTGWIVWNGQVSGLLGGTHHQPPRHPHGHVRALPRRGSPARGAGQPGGGPGIPGPRKLDATLGGAARRAHARRRPDAAPARRHQDRPVGAPRAERPLPGRGHPAHAVGQEARIAGEEAAAGR